MKLRFSLILIFVITPLFFCKTIYASNDVENATLTPKDSSTVINIVTNNFDKSFSYFIENTTSDLKKYYFSKVLLAKENLLEDSMESIEEKKVKNRVINYFKELYTNFISKF
jgi:hypothetical protein